MTRDETERALLGGLVLVAGAYIVAQLGGGGGGTPWNWSLSNRNPGTDADGPESPQKAGKGKPAPEGGPTRQSAATGPKREGPGVIDVYDPAIRLPDGRVVSGATYRRMLNEGYRP